MCGWIGNGILARPPIRPKSAWKALGVIGPPRSVMKTCEDGPCSRFSRLSARISSPCRGWTLGEPVLARRTCSRPVDSSTCDHLRSHSSLALRPWRYPIRIIVASRWPQRLPFRAAAVRRSISRPVRYSRVRTSELTVFGGGRPAISFATIFYSICWTTNELRFFLQYQLRRGAGRRPGHRRRPTCSAPLIEQPISRQLVSPIGPVTAEDVLRLRHLTHRNPRPRHAGITCLVARMILTIGHDILGPVWVVLQEWHSADEVHAGAEHHKHRPPVAVAHQPRAHLIPATHRPSSRHPRVVAMPEPDLAA